MLVSVCVCVRARVNSTIKRSKQKSLAKRQRPSAPSDRLIVCLQLNVYVHDSSMCLQSEALKLFVLNESNNARV